jgi:exodeoxyribonuclease VII large subunit
VLESVRHNLQAGVAGLVAAMRTRLLQHRSRLERMQGEMQTLSPLNILERGYALIFDAEGKLVKDSAQVRIGQEITARLAHGELSATVKRRS